MITILLQKILDLLKEKLGAIGSFISSFSINDPQEGQTLVYDAETEKWVNDNADLTIKDTVTGDEVSFTTNIDLPLNDLKADIVATQSGSGTPSPENVRPISGYSSIVVTQKNGDDETVDTITVSLGDTYYGGVIDIKKGTAIIDKKIIDLGDYTYTYNATYERMSTTVSDLKAVGTVRATPFMCSCFQSIDDGRAMADVPYNSVYAGASGTTLVYIKTQETDPTTFNSAVTGQKLVYPIEPITITGLTPDNFITVIGENVISANSGDVTVSYYNGIAKEVFDVANDIKDLTGNLTIDYLTIEQSSCNVKAYQEGHIVVLEINYMKYLTTPENEGVMITGLPKPIATTTSFVYDIYNSQVGGRMRVNTDGELTQWYFRPYPNHDICGQIVYITDEV